MSNSPLDQLSIKFYRSLSWRFGKYSRIVDAHLEKKQYEEDGLSNVDLIPTDTEKNELITLYNLASSCPSNSTALEIGSYLGASTCYLAAGLAKVKGHLYCVDTWNNETMPEGKRDTFAEFLMNTKNFKHMITHVRKRSSELSFKDIATPLKLVFIDGDHSYEAVKGDFNLVKSWLADDGVIVFHDFGHENFEGVSRVLGEALASGEWVMSGLVGCLAWIKPARWSEPPWFINS